MCSVCCVQLVKRLAGYLPVVIEGEDWESPAEALDDIFLGDAELWCATVRPCISQSIKQSVSH